MCLLEEDLLCVGGINSKRFYLIKISIHQIIKNIFDPKTIYCIYNCLDNSILCSIIDEKGNNYLVKYKYNEGNLIKIFEKEKAHDNYIWICIELNNMITASGGCDCLIKLWKS